MHYYRVPVINDKIDIVGFSPALTLVTADKVAYVASNGDSKETWEEITREEFKLVENQMSNKSPTVEERLAEVKENQIVLMDAVATLFETMIGGVL